jgi:hypothetical protein
LNPWMMLALGFVLGAGAMALFRRVGPTQAQAPDESQALREHWRKTRHDVRGALSPAMLTADRLSGNQDPAISKAGSLIMASLNRALEMLRDPERAQSQPAPAPRVEKTPTS